MEFWLEFEQWQAEWNQENAFANVVVYLPDGRKYGINVWTYQFLQRAVHDDIQHNKNLKGSYLIPPDLFVRELTRACVEATIKDLLKTGPLEKTLNNSVFGIHYAAPWVDSLELPDSGEFLKEELLRELAPEHALSGQRVEVLAKRADKDDVLFRLAGGRLAVVHLTWSRKTESAPYPITHFYPDQQAFWEQTLKADIEEHSP